ncbi:hypothetical protein EHP00_1380 [Ecytonucleospora hepatopenaei]|uniref:Uncharacterized protein n=1 Tax=Ecytonucleospora hepatopenaei TaxID=646526 RepID=A0A1W0E8X1_9MICR|nr:hypothetical protein EHP00_1380 [Ecytonucleospora hepatopenaei]
MSFENFLNKKPEMGNEILNEKVSTIMERLKNSIEQSVLLFKDINDTLEEMIDENKETVKMCDIYNTWHSKIK